MSVAFISVLLVIADGMAQSLPGEGKTIRMGRATWDSGWFQTEIYKQLLERLGYKVHVSTLDNPAFYRSVAQGEVDLWVNGWFPLHNTYEEIFESGARKVGYVAKGGALQGYMVDKKTAEKYDIRTLQDIKRPEVKEALDVNGDGKAELIGCPPGWGCEKVITYQIDAYGLAEHVNVIKADYSASMADALNRYKNGQSIFFYTWTPNWTVGTLEPGKDVIWLTVEEAMLPEDLAYLKEESTISGVTGCIADPCNLGWPANDIRPVANKEFLRNNPAVMTLLEEVRIPIEDVFAQNAKMNQGEDSQFDIERQANEWIEDNSDKVHKWLEAASTGGGGDPCSLGTCRCSDRTCKAACCPEG